MQPSHDQLLGALVGLAVGDAARASTNPVLAADRPTPMPPGAPEIPVPHPPLGLSAFDVRPGVWTASTSMALCLGTSLVETGRFDPGDQMRRYLRWWREGYMSATGRCLGIGITTRQALRRFEETGDPLAGNTDPRTAGNGSLLRLAPVVIWAHRVPNQALALARESSLPTHAADDCLDACEYLAGLLILAWSGADLSEPMHSANPRWSPTVRAVATADYRNAAVPSWPPSNYVVDTLTCARRVMSRSHSFREAIRLAIELGGSSPLVAVVAGQLAGARWGLSGIPEKWVARLVMGAEIVALGKRLAAEGPGWREPEAEEEWSEATPVC